MVVSFLLADLCSSAHVFSRFFVYATRGPSLIEPLMLLFCGLKDTSSRPDVPSAWEAHFFSFFFFCFSVSHEDAIHFYFLGLYIYRHLYSLIFFPFVASVMTICPLLYISAVADCHRSLSDIHGWLSRFPETQWIIFLSERISFFFSLSTLPAGMHY